jgi:putative transposase
MDKANRKTQSEFQCVQCGYAEHADVVGAINVATKAEVRQPIVRLQ